MKIAKYCMATLVAIFINVLLCQSLMAEEATKSVEKNNAAVGEEKNKAQESGEGVPSDASENSDGDGEESGESEDEGPLTKLDDPAAIFAKLKDGKKLPKGTELVLDYLADRSKSMSIFKLKALVLNNNIIKVVSDGVWCKPEERAEEEARKIEKESKSWLLIDVRTDTSNLESDCLSPQELSPILDKALNLALDDKWIQNKNIEERITYVESIVQEIGPKILDGKATKAERKIFFRNTKAYLARFNTSARYNVGLGAALSYLPAIKIKGARDIDYSDLTSMPNNSLSVEYESEAENRGFYGMLIAAKTPYALIDIILPNDDIDTSKKSFPVGLIGENEAGVGYLSKNDIEIDLDIKYEVQVKFRFSKLIQLFQKESSRGFDLGNQYEFGLGYGYTGVDVTKRFIFEARKMLDQDDVFSELAPGNSNVIEDKSSEILRFVSAYLAFNIGDQIEADVTYKMYTENGTSADFDVEGSSFNLGLKYYFF